MQGAYVSSTWPSELFAANSQIIFFGVLETKQDDCGFEINEWYVHLGCSAM
jgi:hypothetical protein